MRGHQGKTALALVSLLLVSACLRPTITSVGPLLHDIHATTGLGQTQLGLWDALPVLMFALFSPFAAFIARVRGVEMAIAGALLGLLVGVIIGSSAGLPGLWLGTALAGASISVANVVTPTLVKRDFAKPSLAMALFTTALSASAALASRLSVPSAEHLGGWRAGLLVWALRPALVLPIWMLRTRSRKEPFRASAIERDAFRSVARSPIAWQVSTFFGSSL